MSDNGPNDFLRKMLDASETRGWYVVDANLKSPGFVTVASSSRPDTEVTIRSPYGIHNVNIISSLPDLKPEPKS
jgi:hypothetical protein